MIDFARPLLVALGVRNSVRGMPRQLALDPLVIKINSQALPSVPPVLFLRHTRISLRKMPWSFLLCIPFNKLTRLRENTLWVRGKLENF